MDPQVWKHLVDHEDILRLIFSRFSWDTNLRLRSVSKAFHATLSEPSFLTWSSMLNDRSFHADHPNLEWVDSPSTDTDHLKQSHADPIRLFSTSQTYALVNFQLHRWCKLPPVGHLPFGDLRDFKVAGVASGLFLLERKISHVMDDLYELDRFLFNPLTRGFRKLPTVPKVKDTFEPFERQDNHLQYPMIMTVDNEKSITVVAIEICMKYSYRGQISRILIWRQSGEDWEPLETNVSRITHIFPVENAVFAGGELFLHTVYAVGDYRRYNVVRCEGRATDPEIVSFSEFSDVPFFHLFQHRGVLKRLTGTSPPGIDGNSSIKLSTFDHMNGSWQEHDMIEMPKQMLKKLYDTLPDADTSIFFVDVLDDTLCIGNRLKADIFFLYNFLSNQWSECSAKELVGENDDDQKIFLWSPQQSYI